MKTFTETGWYSPTLTTTEDPLLKVYERDNGHSWTISFYVGDTIIDCINMEYFSNLHNINKKVLELPVYCSDSNVYLGILSDRLKDAYHIMH